MTTIYFSFPIEVYLSKNCLKIQYDVLYSFDVLVFTNDTHLICEYVKWYTVTRNVMMYYIQHIYKWMPFWKYMSHQKGNYLHNQVKVI